MDQRWWEDAGVVERVVGDVVAGEWARLRPTAAPMSGDLPDLQPDSIEIVSLARAVNEFLHLHESGVEDHLLARRTMAEWSEIARIGLASLDSSLTFRTSGSVDAPKRCTHALDALCQEVDALAPTFTGCSRVLSAVRSHHIYGFLFTVLLPRALGIREVIDVRHQLPSSIARTLREGDLVIGYPEFWRTMVETDVRIPGGVIATTSTAPCPDEVARGVRQLGFDALVQIYGSTETAGVGTRTNPDDPYALMPFWERSGDRLLRTMPDGSRVDSTPPDTLSWRGERAFRPEGRVDEAVQVAGVNVFPSRVRRVLMEHAAVADAAVRRDERSGRLKAFVVPRDLDDFGLQRDLEKWVEARLSVAERPRAFSFGLAIPVDHQGKQADWALHD